jgi:hypothetical protein
MSMGLRTLMRGDKLPLQSKVTRQLLVTDAVALIRPHYSCSIQVWLRMSQKVTAL